MMAVRSSPITCGSGDLSRGCRKVFEGLFHAVMWLTNTVCDELRYRYLTKNCRLKGDQGHPRKQWE